VGAENACHLDVSAEEAMGVGFKYSATGLTCGWAGDLRGGYAAGSYWLIKPPRI